MESIMECHTENQQTPMQLYTKGMIQYGFRGMEEEIVNPNDYGIDWDGPISKSNDDVNVIVDEPKQIINIIFYNLWAIVTTSNNINIQVGITTWSLA
ncbi:unnamed protein product [Rhizophagus irregularis]|nr:unnamed protein product [Rhizophagus irregularis]